MGKITIAVALSALVAASALAQQDPDDPGMQDSLIVVCNPDHVDSTGSLQTVLVEIYASTDDTIMYYNFPMRWIAPAGGITYAAGTVFYYPISAWDGHGEMLNPDENYLWQLGMANMYVYSHNPPLFTGGQRIHVWTLHFTIAPYTPSQMVVFDTCFHPVVGGVAFSDELGDMEITPGFQRGLLSIGAIGVDAEGVRPEEFALQQNCPNPFNAQTTISYSLPAAGLAKLAIYDIAGRKVALLDEGMREAGENRVIWDAGDLPSGVYLALVESGAENRYIKMVLLR